MRKMLALFMGLILLGAVPVVAQETSSAASPDKAEAKQARWEGIVMRTNPEKHTLVVRRGKSNSQKTVHYDASTQIVSQAHGSKQATPIDPKQIVDNDRVICLGTVDDKGDFHASLISKRLSNPLSH